MLVSAIIRRASTRQRFRQTSEQKREPLRFPLRPTPHPWQAPALCSTPSRHRREHHSPFSPNRVKRTWPGIFPHLSQASVMYTPCFVNRSRFWASLSCTANALSLRHTSRMRRHTSRMSLEIEVDRGNEVGRNLGAKPCANMPEIEDSGE
jgi:hypothetical protein